jgi:hypothetical protein
MKYLIRLNPRAVNPLTRKVIASKLWEVEPCEKIGGNGRADSPAVIWHCSEIRIDGKSIAQLAPIEAYRELAHPAVSGAARWLLEIWGVCSRGADDAIEIRTTAADVSGN